ncbi:serine hydroxymethyltransferase [Amycolatopsis sp. cmx-11-12]|uniref:serine hydroxymethyltransferase n=1 Tax=Amycolatopsis sp. cmx-11-12 TaxID=2785795 RepID=UPI003917668C
MTRDPLRELLNHGSDELAADDPDLHTALTGELRRQTRTLSLVASSSVVHPSVLASQASVAVNVTAEGYPGRRYHAGCAGVDEIERLAIDRARKAFGARYANVQPHSATTANYTVLSSIMSPGETLLGMTLEQGGHLTHGSPAALAGDYFNAVGYGLDAFGAIDYEEVARLAAKHRPKVIICGATAYPRRIDFRRFRRIADEVGAYLLADISHTAGMVATGLHPSPIDHAHVTTTCTHKQLYGPRGGLILCGQSADLPAPSGKGTLATFLQRAVFPFSQGAPMLNAIAAKARALDLVTRPEFGSLIRRVAHLAEVLAQRLLELGHDVVTGGTDNHIVLVDLTRLGMSGLVAERALEECDIVVNKNRVPGDTTPALVTSGLRIGTNSAAWRGMGPDEARQCAELIDLVLRHVRPSDIRQYTMDPQVRTEASTAVTRLCARFPLRAYPVAQPEVAGL